MRILLIGDTHGNFASLEKIVRRNKKRFDVDVAFQLGDFGFLWDESSHKKLMNLNNIFKDIDLPLYWLDGNHENFDLMDERFKLNRHEREFQPMFSHITYSGRGNSWEWDGIRFLSYGGAVSIDQQYRTKFVTWWPQERIDPADVEELPGQKIDILLSHDTPRIPDKLKAWLSYSPWRGHKLEIESVENSTLLNRVIEKTHPRHVFHGHMHYDYVDTMVFPHGEVMVRGLNESSTGNRSIWIIDTENL